VIRSARHSDTPSQPAARALLIGDGTHERVVVNVAKSDERVQRKLSKA
jgi:predicted thioesterase